MQSFKQFFIEATEGKNVPSVLYHVTKVSNVDSIMKNGLEPRKVTVPGVKTRTPRVYLFSNINADCIDMIELFQHKIEGTQGVVGDAGSIPPDQYEDVAVIKVTLPKGIKIYRDPWVHVAATNAYFIPNKTIEPQYLEVVYKGPIKGKTDKSLKSFVKSYGIEGDPYTVWIIFKEDQIGQLANKFASLIKKAGGKRIPQHQIIEDGIKSSTLNISHLAPLKELLHFHKMFGEMTLDSYFKSPMQIRSPLYSDTQGEMTFERERGEFYGLGMDRKKLVEILVKEFNAKVATSGGELKNVYNEMVTEMGQKKLTIN